jgi:dTDP-4-dehydrorhamnose 3,5-epimerase
MDIIQTTLQDLFVLQPKVFEDNRGYFFESFSQSKLPEHFKKLQFIQDNQSLSLIKGTLRGIHFQNHPKAQTKLVRCIQGSILDVAVDLRVGSPTYLKFFSVELTEGNKLQLLVPQGFGHAFITLEDNTIVSYKVDEYYSKEHGLSKEASIHDVDLCMIMGAGWPFHLGGITPYLDRIGASEKVFGKTFHNPQIRGVRS